MFFLLQITLFTFEYGDQLRYGRHSAGAEVLAHGHLQQEDGDAAEDHRDEVDDEEDSCRGCDNEREEFVLGT